VAAIKNIKHTSLILFSFTINYLLGEEVLFAAKQLLIETILPEVKQYLYQSEKAIVMWIVYRLFKTI
jgi:hypothetical protein